MRHDQLLKLDESDRIHHLTEKLGIPINTICRVREIGDRRKRLLRAMQIATKYQETPYRATVLMLARYTGISVIAHYFGSYHNLRVEAGTYSGNADTCPWPDVKFSQANLRRNVRIPEVITEDVAELMGIHIGDGHQHMLNDSYISSR